MVEPGLPAVGPDEHPTARVAAAVAAEPGAERDAARPIIVLTYAHAGSESLTTLLSASRALACTPGIGLVPVCHAAISTWQEAEGSGRPPSRLAVTSVRAMATAMITVILARTGSARLCETAFATPAAAATFLSLFPSATFICLHRALPAVLAEGSVAYPWGLGGSPFWPYSGAHPGNNAATISAFWAARTEQLLEFESQHPRSCLRVRHEDITADLPGHAADLYTRLGLDHYDQAAPQPAAPALERRSRLPYPAVQIPPALAAAVSKLHARLGYELEAFT